MYSNKQIVNQTKNSPHLERFPKGKNVFQKEGLHELNCNEGHTQLCQQLLHFSSHTQISVVDKKRKI